MPEIVLITPKMNPIEQIWKAEGIAAAKVCGVHMGRPVINTPLDFDKIVNAWEKKEITMEEAMKRSGMSETTFYRRRREMLLIKSKQK